MIETARLFLRPPQPGDVEAMVKIHQDPEVLRFLAPGSPPADAGIAWRNVAMMIGHWHIRGYGPFVVGEKAGGELIGRAGLWNPDGWPGVELGWLIQRSHWGRGFATEAAKGALDWAWDNVAVEHIISMIHPQNTRSIRVAEKIGERFERAEVKGESEMHIYGVNRRPAGVRTGGASSAEDPRG
jgi:RimJ/RimL family protein N-acetyltransferase